jgi:hypothetical protein
MNRVKIKQKGWLAPSVEHKINSHLRIVKDVHKILPISKIIVEVASFDIQKIKNPDIQGAEYQQGEQLNFWNVREYVLFRDRHKCQGRKGCNGKILQVHHIESRQTGGNSPSNLITLCQKCHGDLHKGELELKLKRGNRFRDATFMGIMRWKVLERLRDVYPNVNQTYGYLTKNNRISQGLPKEHRIDAFCISDNLNAELCSNNKYNQKFVRKNNRSLFKANQIKGGRWKANKAPRIVCGFRLFDKVKFGNQECFVFGRRTRGSFSIRKISGEVVHTDAPVRKIILIESSRTLLAEKKGVVAIPLNIKMYELPCDNIYGKE